MNRIRTKQQFLFLLCMTLAFASTAWADTAVWKITNGDNHLFIGGTVHVLSESDFPLPGEFDEAYGMADSVVFETDISGMSEPENQMKLMQSLSYQDGTTLEDHVSAEIFDQIEAFLTERQIPVEQIALFKPGMVMSVMTMVELQRLGMAGDGVDRYFNEKAVDDGKDIGQLETIDEQVEFMSALGEKDPDTLFEYTIRDLDQLSEVMQKLKDAWREGDMDGMADTYLDEMQRVFPDMYERLLVGRNRDWLPLIESMFKTPEIEFVLVGAAHLAGEGNVLKMLEERGYDIKPL